MENHELVERIGHLERAHRFWQKLACALMFLLLVVLGIAQIKAPASDGLKETRFGALECQLLQVVDEEGTIRFAVGSNAAMKLDGAGSSAFLHDENGVPQVSWLVSGKSSGIHLSDAKHRNRVSFGISPDRTYFDLRDPNSTSRLRGSMTDKDLHVSINDANKKPWLDMLLSGDDDDFGVYHYKRGADGNDERTRVIP